MSRFHVTYRLAAANRAAALARAEGIAVEQTVEIPREIVPEGYIEDVILGQVEDIGTEEDGAFRAVVSYSPDSCGDSFAQFLNVVFGNSSLQKGIKVIGIDPGPMADHLPGARFGLDGIRRLAGVPTGPLIAPVLKPQGSDCDRLATIAYICARAGAHIVKEDHGLADQSVAPFRERVEKIAAAVRRANDETGGSTLYFPSLLGHHGQELEMARFAKDAGANGVLVMPGLSGFGLVHRLATSREPMPVMTHPSLLGPYVLSDDFGFSHAALFGTLQRLAGSDISVFPNVGGRFGFTDAECRAIAQECHSVDGHGAPIFPSPGGGMSIGSAAEMLDMFGPDVVFLLGGSLLREGNQMGPAIERLLATLRQSMAQRMEGFARHDAPPSLSERLTREPRP